MVDWHAMSVIEIWRSLRASPNVAGPWIDESMGELAHRKDHHGKPAVVCWPGTTQRHPYYPSREEADRYLRIRGWLLVDKLGECKGCDASSELEFCATCCPPLYCKKCQSATGGTCREHNTEGREPWGPGWF